MKKVLLLIILTIIINYSYSQSWLWATEFDGNALLETEGLGIDSLNNIYILTELNASSVVQGVTTNSYGDKDIQISKFTNMGSLLWTKHAGEVNTDDPKGIYTDLNGNSYIVGSFVDTAKFGMDSIISTNNKDAFVAKYNSNGDVIWVRNFAWGYNVQKGTAITVDDFGYISILGFFKDSVIFGDSINAANCDTLLKVGNRKNYFYVKLDQNGNYIFSKLISSNSNLLNLNYLVNYNSTSCYIAGYFIDNLIVDNDTLISKGGRDIAIINLDNFGNVVWAKSYGDSNDDNLFGIDKDENDNLFITGNFEDSLSFGLDTLKSIGNSIDMYVAKLNTSGVAIWDFSAGSYGTDYGWSITYKNNVLQMSGSFNDTIVWNNDSIYTSSHLNNDAFICKANALNGDKINIDKINANNVNQDDIPRDIVIDYFGNLYVSGYFKSDYLYIGQDTLMNSNPGVSDVFLARYGCNEVNINFASTPTTCAGYNDATISAVPSLTDIYDYNWSNGDTTQYIDTIPEGIYYVTVTNSYGCSYYDSTLVTHIPTLETQINGDTVIINCADGIDGSAIVTPVFGVVDSGFTYLWDNGIMDSLVSTLDTGLHYVTVTDYCGSKTDSIFVDYKPTLTAQLMAHIVTVPCEDSQIGEGYMMHDFGVAPYHYIWSNNDTTQSVHDLNVGTHYVTITDICNVPITDSLTVYHLPKMFSIVSESNKASCTNTSDGTAIILAHSGVPPYNYQWDTLATGIDSLATNLNAGWHYVTITDACGNVTDSVEIKVKPELQVSYSVEDLKCFGDTNASITVSVQDGVSPISIQWSDTTENTYILDSLPIGKYYYTVSDFCGSISDTIEITQPLILNDTIMVSNVSETGKKDGELDITIMGGTSPYTYFWSNGSVSEDLNYLTEDTFYVTVTDANNCSVLDSAIVLTDKNTITIVNAFSPNGDGFNDVWNIKNISTFPNCVVNIYNQWGTIVFESKGYTKPWDGTYKGKQLPTDTYYYIIDLKDDDATKPFTGSVTIVK